MKGQHIIAINGRQYDALSGLPVSSSSTMPAAVEQHAQRQVTAPKPGHAFSDIGPTRHVTQAKPQHLAKPAQFINRSTQQTPHHSVHKSLQKSQTLARNALKKPVSTEAVVKKPKVTFAPHPTPFGSHEQSPLLSHGRPVLEPQAAQKPKTTHHKQAEDHQHQEVAQQTPTSLKDQLIKERIAEAEAAKAGQKKPGFFARLRKRQPKLATTFAMSLSVLILGTYLTYINLPNISMRVAATRAGINATLPAYKPDGYSLSGAIAYAESEVSVNYKSNTGDQSYTVSQRASSWDSQAVLSNYVSKQTNAYLTFQDRGLTVYTFGNKAAWTNGGLLYTIDGDAPLSSDQILKIATSM